MLKPPVAPGGAAPAAAGAGAASRAASNAAAAGGAQAPRQAAADGGVAKLATPDAAADDSGILQLSAADAMAPPSALPDMPLAGSPAPPRTPAPSASGQVLITELMIDPKTLSDTQGEWVELHNTTDMPLDLQGCSLDDGGKEPRLLDAPFVAPGLGYVTIARSEQPGFEPSYVTSLSLTNTADTIALRCAGVEIDRVSYDKALGFALVSGASLSLDPGHQTAEANDVAQAWCPGSESYGPELGSPGRANPACDPSLDAGVEP
jgi:hypothetical protein